jgi:hypothetical protein
MNGSSVNTDPDGAVGVGKKGSFIGVVRDEAVAFGEELPVCSVKDIDAEVGSDPQPAAAVEVYELNVGRDDVGAGERCEEASLIVVDAEMEERGKAAADPERAVSCCGDAAHLSLHEGFVESDLSPLTTFSGLLAGETVEVMVGDKPECAVGSFGCVSEGVGETRGLSTFSGRGSETGSSMTYMPSRESSQIR